MRLKAFLATGIIVILFSVFASAALDLAFVGTITQTPDPATAGATVTFSVSFRTNGGAVTNMKIIGGVDGTQLHQRTFASIGADLTRNDSFTWTAAAGNHTAWFELDPDHTCGDSNYANNRIEKAITVGGGSNEKPDLYISNVVFSPPAFSSGKTVTLTITVANKGTADAPATDLFMKNDSGKVLMIHPMAAIPKGGQYVHKIDWAGLCGTELTIKVDTAKKVDELDENNNAWVKKMTCGELKTDIKIPISNQPTELLYVEDPNGPDLQVRISSLKKFKSEDHESLYIQYEVSNWGKVASVPCLLTGKSGKLFDLHTTIEAVSPGINIYGEYYVTYKSGMQIRLEIDANKKNVESNEHNNVYRKTVTDTYFQK